MMLNSGLDGVKNKLTPPPSVDCDIYGMCDVDMKKAKVVSMPANLQEAIEVFKKNPIAKETLGEHIFERYVTAKEAEWDSYRISVTDWEIKNYLNIY
jgi:glutamine synthetase